MVQNIHLIRALPVMLMTGLIFGGSLMMNLERVHAAPKAQIQLRAPIDINKAGAEELQAVRGIGPALAERIVLHRRETGRFDSLDDLMQVRGIGQAKFSKIKTQITL